MIGSFLRNVRPRSRARSRRGFTFLLALAALGPGACDLKKKEVGELGAVGGFIGGVTADEPRAALVARDVLSRGGTAADAAAALYLALSVTRPSATGLGGGGVCLVYDRQAGGVEVLDFWPRGRDGGRGTVAVPTAVRALFTMTARHGALPWSQVVGPAERLARFGNPVSRAFAADLSASGRRIADDRTLRAMFTDATGALLREGDVLAQPELGALLASIRVEGPGALHGGLAGGRIARAAGEFGLDLTLDDLRAARPRIAETVSFTYENEKVHFARKAASLTPADPGAMGLPPLEDLPSGRRTLARELAKRAVLPLGASGPDGPSGRSGFVVVDRDGNAVSCETTMGIPFGGGILPRTGLMLAPAGDGAEADGPIAGPMMMVNENVGDFRYAAAGSGGVAGTLALLRRIGRDLVDDRPGVSDGAFERLAGPGLAHSISCPEGLPALPDGCRFSRAPNGHGLALR